jgi:hypothetical protein
MQSFGVCFLTLAQQLFFFFLSSKALYVKLMDKEKNPTYVMYIARLSDCSKRVKKIFKTILEEALRNPTYVMYISKI